MPAITGPRFLTQGDLRDVITTGSDAPVLGSRAETLDGRIYRAMEVGATALVKGNLLQGPANVAAHINRVIGDAAVAGDRLFTFDSGATLGAVNDYAGGYAVINDAAGEGIAYHISGHAAWASNDTSVRINIDDPLETALTADTSEVSLHSIWRNVIQNPTSATNVAVGVADVAYAINDTFWGQVWGVASVLQEATAAVSVIGGGLVPSDTAAGAVEITAQAVTALQEIGRALVVSVDEEHNGVWLTIG